MNRKLDTNILGNAVCTRKTFENRHVELDTRIYNIHTYIRLCFLITQKDKLESYLGILNEP